MHSADWWRYGINLFCTIMPRFGLDLALTSYMEEWAAIMAEILWGKIKNLWSAESRAWVDISE